MAVRVNAQERRRAIVDSAAELFDREGYHLVGVEQLAEAVGLRKPTLYHYFASKDAILFEIHEEFIDLLIAKAEARRGDMAASEELTEMMGDVLELMDSHRGHVRVFFEHYRELSDDDQSTIRVKRDHYQRLVEAVIERGVANGEFRVVDPRLTSFAVFGMCNWTYQWYRSGGALSSREVAEHFAELLLAGLRA